MRYYKEIPRKLEEFPNTELQGYQLVGYPGGMIEIRCKDIYGFCINEDSTTYPVRVHYCLTDPYKPDIWYSIRFRGIKTALRFAEQCNSFLQKRSRFLGKKYLPDNKLEW